MDEGARHLALDLPAGPEAAGTVRGRIADFAQANGAGPEHVAGIVRAVVAAIAIAESEAGAGGGRLVCDADVAEGTLEVVVADRPGRIGPGPAGARPGRWRAVRAHGDDDELVVTTGDPDGVEVWMRFALG